MTKKPHFEKISFDYLEIVKSIIADDSLSVEAIATFRQLINQLEIDEVRKAVMPLFKFDSWINLSEKQRGALFEANPKLETLFLKGLKSYNPEINDDRFRQIHFTSRLIDSALSSPRPERLDCIVDMLSQLPTRRVVKPILIGKCFSERIDPAIEKERVDRILFLINFPLNDFTAEMLSQVELEEQLETVRDSVRSICWKHKLTDLSLSSSSVLFGSVEKISKFYDSLPPQVVEEIIFESFQIVPNIYDFSQKKLFMNRLLFKDPLTRSEPLFPTELGNTGPSQVRLGLQYLSIADLIDRNHQLFRIEAKNIIKDSVADAAARMRPKWTEKIARYVFEGASRMGLEIQKYEILEVYKNSISFSGSSKVILQVSVDVSSLVPAVLAEWDSLRPGDCLLFASLTPPDVEASLIRGGELIDIADSQGNALSTAPFGSKGGVDVLVGSKRIFKVAMDPKQHDLDVLSGQLPELQILVRTKDSQFKNMLKVLSSLTTVAVNPVPEWVSDIVSGYGDPESVNPFRMLPLPNGEEYHVVKLRGVFVDSNHFSLVYPHLAQIDQKSYSDKSLVSLRFFPGQEEPISADFIIPSSPGPLLEPKEPLRLTRNQIDGLVSATLPGMTLIKGGPGTGKTLLTSKIIESLYFCKENRTLLLAKSNESLNSVLALLAIPKEYILKPGGASDDEFSRASVINHMLQQRLDLLARVKQLALALGSDSEEADNFSYSCDSANQFYLNRVFPLIQKFQIAVSGGENQEQILTEHIENDLIFGGCAGLAGWDESIKSAREKAKRLLEKNRFEDILFPFKSFSDDFSFVDTVFKKLKEYAFLEILRSTKDRSQYLLTSSQAKVVAVTSAGLCNSFLSWRSQKLKFTSLVVETTQMLEIETFLGLSLSLDTTKRVVLIGDDLDLPPVVTNKVLSEENNFSQTLFSRLIRLGVRSVSLNTQFRAPQEIAQCWTWKYNISTSSSFSTKNEKINGLKYTCQFIDVPDFNDQGETQPMAHFYQNLGEAETIVAFFMYLRLNGVKANDISILASYNGQRLLIEDILKARCGSNPLFGFPAVTSTIDQYQGQHNKVVLVSLVRTDSAGHNADHRRLISACSRASQGLFVFGRLAALEATNTDVKNIIHFLAKNGTRLVLELYGKEKTVQDVNELWDVLRTMMESELGSV